MLLRLGALRVDRGCRSKRFDYSSIEGTFTLEERLMKVETRKSGIASVYTTSLVEGVECGPGRGAVCGDAAE